jgi:hypothetical protein
MLELRPGREDQEDCRGKVLSGLDAFRAFLALRFDLEGFHRHQPILRSAARIGT